MPAMTYYLQNQLVTSITQASMYTPPGGLWLGLFTTETDAYGAGTEVAGGGYLRRVVVFGTPSGGTVKNTNNIFFPTATTAWNSIGWVGIFDAASGGNMLFFGKLSAPVFINLGNTYNLDKDSILLSLK